MFPNLKSSDEQFSTAENANQSRRKNSYSSRYQLSRAKTVSLHKPYPSEILLPSVKQKAVKLIQKKWREFMGKRRKYYSQLLSKLLLNNEVSACLLNKKATYLKSLQNFQHINSQINNLQINSKTQGKKQEIKAVAKQCVKISFKFQKKMLSERDLQKLAEQLSNKRQRVIKLENKKQNLQKGLFEEQNTRKTEILLREIKQANLQLLKIVQEKNKLKHQLHEKEKSLSKQEINQY